MGIAGDVRAAKARLGEQVSVRDVLRAFDVEFDVPLDAGSAVWAVTAALGASGAIEREGLDRRHAQLGLAWCELVWADVEHRLADGAQVHASSAGLARELLADAGRGARGPDEAYVVARWHDGAGKVLYRLGDKTGARRSFENACRVAADHDLWWCQHDLDSNRLRASYEEARFVSATLEGSVADADRWFEELGSRFDHAMDLLAALGVDETRGGGLDGSSGASIEVREVARGACSLAHNHSVLGEGELGARASWEGSVRSEGLARALGDDYRLAQALLHQARLLRRGWVPDETTRSSAQELAIERLDDVATGRWARGRIIATQQRAVALSEADGATHDVVRSSIGDLDELLDHLLAALRGERRAVGADLEVAHFTARAIAGLIPRLPPDEAVSARRRLRARELELAASIRTVVSVPAYKSTFAGTIRPIYLDELAGHLVRATAEQSGAGWSDEEWEVIFARIEEATGRELLDLLAAAADDGLPRLDGRPTTGEGEPAARSGAEPAARSGAEPAARSGAEPAARSGAERRHGLRSALSEHEAGVVAGRAMELAEAFRSSPVPAQPADHRIGVKVDRYVRNHPGTVIVRYVASGSAADGRPLEVAALVARDGHRSLTRCCSMDHVDDLVAAMAAVERPTAAHAVALWEGLIAPIERHLGDLDDIDHLTVIPTDDLFALPWQIASASGTIDGALGVRVPLSLAVNATAYIDGDRHLLRRQGVSASDDLAAVAHGIGARELVVAIDAGWEAEHIHVAGAARSLALRPDAVVRHLGGADWQGLAAIEAIRPEFFVCATHGAFDEVTGPFLLLDGDLATVHDVLLRLRLPRNVLTVMGACLAGQGRADLGGDVAGFVRSLMAAGAGVIAVPTWSIVDLVAANVGGGLLAASRACLDPATGRGTFDAVAALHRMYGEAAAHWHAPGDAWIDQLPYVLYT